MIIWWIAVAVLIAFYTMQSLFTKFYTEKYPGDPDMASNVLTIVSGSAVALITLAFFSFSNGEMAFFDFHFNPWCILIGICNALALYGYNYFIVKASNSGPYSILMMFNLSGGIVIPIIAALVMRWDNSWSTIPRAVLNVIAIASIISAVYMVSSKKEKGTKRTISPRFLLSCFGLALCNGFYGLFLTLQQQSVMAGGENNRDEMVIVTFGAAAIISAVTGVIKAKGRFFKAFKQSRKSFVYLAITSIVFALAINLIVIIIPHFDTTILYTLDNSSVLIMSVLISCIFFKERLSFSNVAGIVIMVCALVGMNFLPSVFDGISNWRGMNIPFAILSFALPVGFALLYKKVKYTGVFLASVSSLCLIMINVLIALFK